MEKNHEKESMNMISMEMASQEVNSYDVKQLVKESMKRYWRMIFFVVWPIALIWIIFGSWNDGVTFFEESNMETATKLPRGYENRYIFRTMYIFLVMSGYWLTECIPMHLTGLIPIFMFPLLNVLSTAKVTACYLAGVNMTFITSLFLAIAIEYSNLHIRIAYVIIRYIGTDPRRLHFGVLTATFLLSMWLLNTAVAAMMCPIVKALLDTLEQVDCQRRYSDASEKKQENQEPSDAAIAYYLGIGYSASIGGLATLIGTGATLLYKSLIEAQYPRADREIVGFVPWTLYCLPTMFFVNCICWLILQILYMGLFRPRSPQAEFVRRANRNKRVVSKSVKDMLKELGPMSWHESWIAGLFALTILLMVTRKPDIFTGWQDALQLFGPDDLKPNKKYVTEPVILVFIVFVMLLVPANTEFLHSFSKDPKKRPKTNSPGLVTWKVLHDKTPWGLLFLIGGGKSLAEAGALTGMTKYVGESLTIFKDIDRHLILALTTLAMTVITQFASNMTAINMIIPVILQLASGIGCHPAFLGHTAGIMASCAFMLPVGTTANVVVGGYGNLSTKHFLKGGTVLVVITYCIVMATFTTYGKLLWPDLDTFPDWART